MSGAAHHRGESRQDYETPPDFMRAVTARFGPVAWDLAATATNAKAADFITPEQDSLSVDWSQLAPHHWLWLNPPFADIEPWAAKCREECERGAMILLLTPASVGTNWYRDHVFRRAHAIFLNARLKFVGATDWYPKDCMLSAFHPDYEVGFEIWTWREPKPKRKRAARQRSLFG